MLTSKERSALRSIAANIEPVTQVGKLGVNESLIESLDKKVRIEITTGGVSELSIG